MWVVVLFDRVGVECEEPLGAVWGVAAVVLLSEHYPAHAVGVIDR